MRHNATRNIILGLYVIVCILMVLSIFIFRPFHELTLLEKTTTLDEVKYSNNKNLYLIRETLYLEKLDNSNEDIPFEKIEEIEESSISIFLEESVEESFITIETSIEEFYEVSFEESIERVEVVEESSIEEYTDIVLMSYSYIRTISIKGSLEYIEVVLYNQNEPDCNYDDAVLFFADIARICKKYDLKGIPLAAMLAQAYTEGGAGKKGVYTHSNNLFGIRAGGNWNGMVYSRDLGKTYINYAAAKKAKGTDLFRAYASIDESIQDYINLITTSDLYKRAVNRSPKQYLKYLVKKGYGSSYMVDTWMYLIKVFKLSKYE